jgi:hypothetical protein
VQITDVGGNGINEDICIKTAAALRYPLGTPESDIVDLIVYWNGKSVDVVCGLMKLLSWVGVVSLVLGGVSTFTPNPEDIVDYYGVCVLDHEFNRLSIRDYAFMPEEHLGEYYVDALIDRFAYVGAWLFCYAKHSYWGMRLREGLLRDGYDLDLVYFFWVIHPELTKSELYSVVGSLRGAGF